MAEVAKSKGAANQPGGVGLPLGLFLDCWLLLIVWRLAWIEALKERSECGGQVHSVKPWRLEDVLGKPLGPEAKHRRTVKCGGRFCRRTSHSAS